MRSHAALEECPPAPDTDILPQNGRAGPGAPGMNLWNPQKVWPQYIFPLAAESQPSLRCLRHCRPFPSQAPAFSLVGKYSFLKPRCTRVCLKGSGLKTGNTGRRSHRCFIFHQRCVASDASGRVRGAVSDKFVASGRRGWEMHPSFSATAVELGEQLSAKKKKKGSHRGWRVKRQLED